MGCDLCVYVPAKEDHDCGMSYSTFNAVRLFVCVNYLNELGYDLDPESVGLGTYGKIQGMLKIQAEKKDGGEFAWTLYNWMNHCDCEGWYDMDECEDLAKALTHCLDRSGKEMGEWMSERIEALRDTFKYAAENDGVVMVY